VIVRGVELALGTVLGSGAGPHYSLSARVTGKLCPSCDLGLPFSCTCPDFCYRFRPVVTLRVAPHL
jgi:hypothetical protein